METADKLFDKKALNSCNVSDIKLTCAE